jgi:3',5'-cyclic AMP phosphodiesterase CpdA
VTTIIQLSDTHITEGGRRAYGRIDTGAALARAVAHINALPERIGPIEAVVLTGDLADLATPGEYAAFRALADLLAPPLYLVPGNHDGREAIRAAFPDADYLPAEGPMHWSRALGGLLVVGLDTTVPGEAHGMLDEAALDWLDGALAGAADRPALVFTHHPPFDTGIGHMDRQRLRNVEALMARLARHPNVALVASGHVHRMIVAAGPVPCVIAPAPAHAVCLDHGADAEPAFALEPGAVLVHAWRPVPGRPFGLLQSQVSFIEAFDGPWPFFAGGRPIAG